ncbi:MAG: nucleotidyl transferase AbiEii/AbiGii toxin family protein [Bacteroidota bacterium]|nr:nucleotidyl transferase AbiEii/AbiGii toxin family protein [Bacteroidota bacterium]
MEAVFSQFGIEYYLAGAFARDVQFKTRNSHSFARKTNDIDLAVCISHEDKYNEVMEALVATGSFTRDPDEIIKLYHRSGGEVDLIPFGEIENKERAVHLTKPKAFTLQMPGFAEVFPFIEQLKSGNLVINTCPVEGLVMLKLLSWHDKPHRTHDLEDIDKIIDAYFDWNADEIYSQHFDVMERYDTGDLNYLSKISAQVVGRKMRLILAPSAELMERILKILSMRENPRWVAIKNGIMENTNSEK